MATTENLRTESSTALKRTGGRQECCDLRRFREEEDWERIAHFRRCCSKKETVDVSTRIQRRRTKRRTKFSTYVDRYRGKIYPGCSEVLARANQREHGANKKSLARCARTATTNRDASILLSVMPSGEELHLKRRHLGHLRENRLRNLLATMSNKNTNATA